MKQFSNLNAKVVTTVLAMTGFNYDLTISSDATTITFDCVEDASKFDKLYWEQLRKHQKMEALEIGMGIVKEILKKG